MRHPMRLPKQPLAIGLGALLALLALAAAPVAAQDVDQNNPGILEPVSTELNRRAGMADPVVRIPNTDQSLDGIQQSSVHGDILFEDAWNTTSLLGHPITRVTSPNDDLRVGLQDLLAAAQANNASGMQAVAQDLVDILTGNTQGRIYDGFAMLNYNRGAYLPDHVEGEYKMKWAVDTGETFTSPFDGEQRKIYEMDVSMLYYDGQIDSDTFLVRFPVDADWEDTLRVNYRIYSLVQEDFSPTLVMLDKREALNTVQFPFKGFDAVWIAFFPGQVLNVTINYPPVRQLRGVYTWGWRIHPPRIQFLQPIYDIVNQVTGEVELDPQGRSYAYRNKTNLTLDAISNAAPEKKIYNVAQAVLNGAGALNVIQWMINPDQGPRGTWVEWADVLINQQQLPPEAWDVLEQEGLSRGDFGDYEIISVFMNNEMYGEGPWENEVDGWDQRETFRVKLINLDNHTHYFRNVDFGTRLNDDILRCCGGGQTSFEVMNFKPSYGAPKVAEMQWRAGWGFRPHYDVILQDGVFPRASDRMLLTPYRSGEDNIYYGYQYSEEARGGDFRFNPPNFVIGFDENDPSPFRLRDVDGEEGLVIGQFTEGYGVAQMCPGDDYPGFCTNDISAYNPNGNMNRDTDGDGVNDALLFPPFLRNPSQGVEGAGDIIPPTGAWRPFLWTNPNNGSLYIDPNDPSQGYWADLTYGHGAPIFAGQSLAATIELPRASGQVFYQFDDLFHDNAIFSPHPLFEGSGEVDEVIQLSAMTRGNQVRVRGRISELSDGGKSNWVTLFDGPAGTSGCTGRAIEFAEVGGRKYNFDIDVDLADLSGSTVCVQSVVGGFAETVVQ